MLSVDDSPQLQAAVLAMKSADRDLRKRINDATRQTMNPVWKSLVEGHMAGTSVMANRVLNKGVRIAAGNPPRAVAASSKRAVGDGKRVTPAAHWPGYEFGADRNAYSRYERKNRTRSGYHVVERRTMRHLPPRTRQGRHVYPAFADIGPRMVSLWVQLIVKTYHDAAEGK